MVNMVKRTIYIFVSGINNFPGSSKNWVGRAVTHIQTKTPHKAEKIEYLVGIFTRTLFQKRNVYKLYRTMQFYRNWNIVLVSHSNGGSLITDMINKYPDFPDIEHIHFINSASEADFEKAQFNKYLKEDRIGRINVYVGGKDYAIRWFAKSIIGRILGYKTLGKFGPYHVEEALEHRVSTFWSHPWSEYTHSSAFSDSNFENTMGYIVGNKKPSKKDIAKTLENKENDASIVLNKTEIKEIRKDN